MNLIRERISLHRIDIVRVSIALSAMLISLMVIKGWSHSPRLFRERCPPNARVVYETIHGTFLAEYSDHESLAKRPILLSTTSYQFAIIVTHSRVLAIDNGDVALYDGVKEIARRRVAESIDFASNHFNLLAASDVAILAVSLDRKEYIRVSTEGDTIVSEVIKPPNGLELGGALSSDGVNFFTVSSNGVVYILRSNATAWKVIDSYFTPVPPDCIYITGTVAICYDSNRREYILHSTEMRDGVTEVKGIGWGAIRVGRTCDGAMIFREWTKDGESSLWTSKLCPEDFQRVADRKRVVFREGRVLAIRQFE